MLSISSMLSQFVQVCVKFETESFNQTNASRHFSRAIANEGNVRGQLTTNNYQFSQETNQCKK
jgi:hypothetical protein